MCVHMLELPSQQIELKEVNCIYFDISYFVKNERQFILITHYIIKG